MIVHPCLRCGMQNLPIEALRCPRCGEENFIPVNRPLSAPESHPEPINDKKDFRDTSTEQTAEAKAKLTGSSPNQHEETEPMSKTINFQNEAHADGIGGNNVQVKRGEEADENNLRCENTVLEQEQQLQICSNDPVLKNNTLEDIPIVYDQAYSSNAEDKDVCGSGNGNFSASVSSHGEEPQNLIKFSRQPQSKLENQSSIEAATGGHDQDELSRFKNEDGKMDFAGCKRCYNQFVNGYLTHLQIECDPKPYRCEQCLCRFRVPRLLKSHLVLHSVERPFICEQCGKTYKRKSNLKEHIECTHKKK